MEDHACPYCSKIVPGRDLYEHVAATHFAVGRRGIVIPELPEVALVRVEDGVLYYIDPMLRSRTCKLCRKCKSFPAYENASLCVHCHAFGLVCVFNRMAASIRSSAWYLPDTKLTGEALLQKYKETPTCRYCRIETIPLRGIGCLDATSIDRYKNNIYTLDNMIVTCRLCNIMKRDSLPNEFEMFCDFLYGGGEIEHPQDPDCVAAVRRRVYGSSLEDVETCSLTGVKFCKCCDIECLAGLRKRRASGKYVLSALTRVLDFTCCESSLVTAVSRRRTSRAGT